MIPRFNKHVLGTGSCSPSSEPISLRAGPLTMVYYAGDLRYLRFENHEIIRRIYAAVRDRNWVTIPSRLRNEVIEVHADSFLISYLSEHRQGDVHLEWKSLIRGGSDGVVSFSFDGEARSTFWKNRIGFCVLHPIEECAGLKCRVEHADGTRTAARFPEEVEAGQPLPGLGELRAIRHAVKPDRNVEIRLEGDIFEMEDQRNWIDASFKTFCTPLRIPFPAEVTRGTHISQQVLVRLSDSRTSPTSVRKRRSALLRKSLDEVAIDVKTSALSLPPIGLGVASHGGSLSVPQLERLRALRLSHLRVDVNLSQPGWRDQFLLGVEQAEDLNTSLEVALFVPPKGGTELSRFATEVGRARPDVARWIIFDSSSNVSGARLAQLARKHLLQFCPSALFGSGSAADFYELNYSRPAVRGLDFIVFSMNPQVHAYDNYSLAETPEGAASPVTTARSVFRDLPVVVSPVTLKPRFNAVATGPELTLADGELPSQVDPRQMSLLGAGWTLAMLRQLIQARVDAVTFFETTGWRGVLETEAGSPLPRKFPSLAGAVFPLYHVFAAVAEYRNGQALRTQSSQALRVQALGFRQGPRRTLLLSNLTSHFQRVAVRGYSTSGDVSILDADTVLDAMQHPDRWIQKAGKRVTAARGHLRFELPPYSLLKLTASA